MRRVRRRMDRRRPVRAAACGCDSDPAPADRCRRGQAERSVRAGCSVPVERAGRAAAGWRRNGLRRLRRNDSNLGIARRWSGLRRCVDRNAARARAIRPAGVP